MILINKQRQRLQKQIESNLIKKLQKVIYPETRLSLIPQISSYLPVLSEKVLHKISVISKHKSEQVDCSEITQQKIHQKAGFIADSVYERILFFVKKQLSQDLEERRRELALEQYPQKHFEGNIEHLRELIRSGCTEQCNYWVGAGISITPPNHLYQRKSDLPVQCHMMLARTLSWLLQMLYSDVFDGQLDFHNKFEWAYRLAKAINLKLEQPDVSDEAVLMAVLDEAVLIKIDWQESIQTYYTNQRNLLERTEAFVRRV